MMTSRNILRSLATVWFTLIMATAAFSADPGAAFPVIDQSASDQKKGSLLFFNIYTSSVSAPGAQNTRISLTNTSDTSAAFVHLFFVDGANCQPSDRFICLTVSQTVTLIALEQDPGITGYLVAHSVNFDGLPRLFNHLIGDSYVKFATGHASALNAEAYAKLDDSNTISPDGTTAILSFIGLPILTGAYDAVSRVVAVDNIPSRADGNDTIVILNRVGGNLATGASTLGSLFGILYNDAEEPHSFTVSGGCQLRSSLSNNFPRTSPRFEVAIPAGQTGWMKIFSTSEIGIVGSVINFNPNTAVSAGAFNGGHNLHKLRLLFLATYSVPIFPPAC